MGLFKRKKKEPELAPEPEPVKTPCEIFGHMWQDFPWFIVSKYDAGKECPSQILVKEIYVCRICHEIKEVTLSEYVSDCKHREHVDRLEAIKEKLKDHIKPQEVVMDMVHDTILVDREKLKYWEQLHAPKENKNETTNRSSETATDLGYVIRR